MKTKLTEMQLLGRIRFLVLFFVAALIVSGITAFPLESELSFICSVLGVNTGLDAVNNNVLHQWFYKVYTGISETNRHYPFMAYGTDWLAFAHIMIAIAFLGVYFKPVRNIWIVYWGMIACISIFPLAFICGTIRGIPFYWMIIDCSFGLFGMIPLLLLRHYIKELARISGYYISTEY